MARWFRKCEWKVRTGLVSGVAILLLVDVIWVGSAGLTRFLFIEESYEKPFFTTYFKTSLFSIYLLAFVFWRPWQRHCWKEVDSVCRCGRLGHKVVCAKDVEGGHRSHHTATSEVSHQRPQQEEDISQINSSTSLISSSRACAQFPPDGNGCQRHSNVQNPATPVCDHQECIDNGRSSCQDQQPEDESSECREEGIGEEGVELSAERERLLSLSDVDGLSCQVAQRKVFDVPSLSGSLNQAVCSVRPKLDICLLGPPEFESIGCCDSDDEVDKTTSTKCASLSPCEHKDCKVRFSTTIEVRERMGNDCRRHGTSSRGSSRQHRSGHIEPLSIWKVMGVAFIFGILWFFANYLYAIGLDKTTVAAVNTISAISGVFVMILAAVPILNVTEGDKFTLSRLVVTLISVGGAVMVSLSPSGVEHDHKKFNYGAIFALGGAALYALYLVLLKKVVQHHEALDIPMFFGFVGLFDFLLLLPLVLIWDVTGIETFEFPPTADVWTLLLVNGFVGTVLSELLWLWAVFLTSPLLGTLALSLVTPLSIAYSIVVGKASFSWLFFFGAVLIIIAFIGVTVLDHFGAWDPLWIGTKKLFVMAKDASQHRGYRSLSAESQRLISSEQLPNCEPEYIIT